MRHIPHVLVPGPWDGDPVLPDATQRHLTSVLRLSVGDPVHYTDGSGTIGDGTLGFGVVNRGTERFEPEPARLDLVVAPPRSKDRVRFLVEKVAELGATSLRWIRTARCQVPPPNEAKVRAWADAALEQSRGAWRLEVGTTTWAALDDEALPLLVADPDGAPLGPERLPAVIVVGPEGGLTREEVPNRGEAVTMGGRILRTETAAVVAAALCRARPA